MIHKEKTKKIDLNNKIKIKSELTSLNNQLYAQFSIEELEQRLETKAGGKWLRILTGCNYSLRY
jgi:hypothetical protein